MINTTTVTASSGADPRNSFLTPADVMQRYGWARTKGYETMRNRIDGFPPRVAGRYRLDTLLAWEDRLLAASGWEPAPGTPAVTAAPEPQLPPKRKPGRPRKDAD